MMYLKLAWRNLWRNWRRTLITAGAIVFAVVAAIVLQSMNRGSYEVMIDRMVSFGTGYVQLQDYRYQNETSLDNAFYFDETLRNRVLASDSRIRHIAPRIQTFMLAANETSTRGAMVFGMDLHHERKFNQIEDFLQEGGFFESGREEVVVAEGLASRLELAIGDTLALIGQGRFGMSASGLYLITGILRHPVMEMNNAAVFMPLDAAQFLLSADDHITALLIQPESARLTEAVATSLRNELAETELAVYTWPELLPEILDLMEMDMAMPRLLAVILYIVIGFGFWGTVLTMTMERMREFGVLISVGMKRLRLSMVILLETLFISSIGALGGMGLSWIILKLIDPIHLTGSAAETVLEMGFDPIIPMSFAPDMFYTQAFFVFLIAVVVFLFPLMKIHRLNVLEAARS